MPEKAILSLDRGVCVHAGAGSGKTTLLVSRFLDCLANPDIHLGGVVAITFTEKAALEMKERIRTALQERVHAQGQGVWTRRLEEIGDARISTIHAFCASLLRQYPVEAGVDPSFEMSDGLQTDLLLDDVLRDRFAEMMDSKNTLLLRVLGHTTTSDLMDILSGLLRRGAFVRGCTEDWKKIGRPALESALRQAKESHPKDKALHRLQWSKDDETGQAVQEAMLELVSLFGEAFDAAKRAANRLDFEDLQTGALALLKNDRVRKKIRRDIQYLLVDEFQDTDELQRQIVYLLADLRQIFVVGDPKQSIYRFRGADVSVFGRIRQDMQAQGQILDLDKNYRSAPHIVSFCNAFFGALPHASGLPFDIAHQPMEATRPAVPVAVPGLVAWRHRVEPKDKVPVDVLRAREAKHVAQSIQRCMEENPGLRYRDIAVLFRSMNKPYLYERELQRLGIPFETSSTGAFFAQQCITDVLNALRAAHDHGEDVAMLGFLRSPMVGLSDEDLLRLTGQPSLWDAMQRSKDSRVVQARTWLESWHASCAWTSPARLLETVLRDTDFAGLVLTQRMGVRKAALLARVEAVARRFARMEEFLVYLKGLVLQEKREAEGPAGEEADAVQILTVHKAKGLEFPVVILADLGHQKHGDTKAVLPHAGLGLGLKLRDAKNEELPTVQRALAKLQEEAMDLAESKRVLYVACTRARDRLILSGLDPRRSRSNPWNTWILDYLESPDGKKAIDARTWIEQDITPLKSRAISSAAASPAWDEGAWEAAAAPLANVPSQGRFTATQLQELLEPTVPATKAYPPGSTAATRIGTAVHAVLAHLETARSALETSLERVLQDIPMDNEEGREVRRRATAFVRGPIWTKLLEAKQSHCELPFLLPLGDCFVEGILDKLYQSREGAWAVLDYKTDNVSAEQVPARAAHYAIQLRLYAAAAIRILGLEEIRLELCFLTPEKLHREVLTRAQAEAFLQELEAKIAGSVVSSQASTANHASGPDHAARLGNMRV